MGTCGGVGLLNALENEQPLRPWLASSAAADITDVAAVLGSWRDLGSFQRWPFLLIAGGAASLGVKLALELE